MNAILILTLLMGTTGVFIIILTLPLILELSLVTFAHLLPKRILVNSAVESTTIAVIVPAHNEELLISRCVRSLLEAATERTRILVIAHNCSDKTAEIAEEAGAEVVIYNDAAAAGKGYALRHGFEHALRLQADSVLVVDADSTLSNSVITTVERALANGAEVVQCKYSMTTSTLRSNARLAALAFRGFNFIRPDGRQRLGLSCGILGNGFAIRSSILRSIPYEALSVVEDLEYHIHLVMAGKRVHYLEDALISAELPTSREGEATQRARWEGGRVRAARRWCGPLLGQVLSGRLRLVEPLLEVASLPLAYGAFLLVIGVCLPLQWLRIYSVASICIMAVHVLTVAWLSPDRWGTLRLLTMAPIYILWKIRIIPALLRGSSSRASWIRTKRDSDLSDIAEKPVPTAQ